MRNVFSLCVQNVPGVLSHVAGMLAARGYNVDSLTVCAAENPALSNMTIVLDVDPRVADQVGSQLQKLVTAVETHNLSRVPHIERELALIRVEVAPSERTGVVELTNIFRAKIVDVGVNSIIIELTGSQSKLEAFFELTKEYETLELARTGITGLSRGSDGVRYL